VLRVSQVREASGLVAASPLDRAALAVLDFIGDEIVGFFHEVFFNYWLAEHIVDRLVGETTTAEEIAELFSLQRSYVTNKLVRQRIESREDRSRVASRLREAFDASDPLGPRRVFARNQVLYLIARIDSSEATQRFVRSIWYSDEAEFVRYSAAFSAVILGDTQVEDEYYQRLLHSPTTDRLNRGYHLSYYGDVAPLAEAEAAPDDDGASDAGRTLTTLFRRLARTESRHRRLRRIELLTIRRFLETGRGIPEDVGDPMGVLDRLTVELTASASSEFQRDALTEVDRIRKLIGATGAQG
jgi:hypothetical protein